MLCFNFVQVIIHVHVLVCVNCVRIRSCIWIMSDGLGANSWELFWPKFLIGSKVYTVYQNESIVVRI